MVELSWNDLPAAHGRVGVICASVAGYLLSQGDLKTAGDVLDEVARASGSGMAPGNLDPKAKDAAPDVEGNLWFVRAAWAYRQAGGDAEKFKVVLLPVIKRIVQGFISANESDLAGVRMDDGGLLVVEDAGSRAMRYNALWYAAMEAASASLHEIKDPAGDHFERLAGRFRRSFAKAYWCDDHGFVCGPEARKDQDHFANLPDAEQLLFAVLPVSPIPKTKQRQIVQELKTRLVGQVGLKMDASGRESTLHRSWLVEGLVSTAESRGSVLAEARTLMKPLADLLLTRGALAAEYVNGKSVGEKDTVATAEAIGVLARLAKD